MNNNKMLNKFNSNAKNQTRVTKLTTMDDSGDNIDQEEEFSSGDFDENTAVHTKSKTIRMSPEKTKMDKLPSPQLNSSINPTSAQSSIAP